LSGGARRGRSGAPDDPSSESPFMTDVRAFRGFFHFPAQVVLWAVKRVRPEGDIALAGLKGTVLSLLKLTRMDKAFQVFDSAEAAAAMLSG
jgi:hypothetical protein